MSCQPQNHICTDMCEGCVDIFLCANAYAAVCVIIWFEVF